jgi:signal transduction histidine kinase
VSRTRRVVVLALVGAAAIIGAEWASIGAYVRIDPANVAGQLLRDALPPTVYITAGIIATSARPDSRIGLWLWLAGVLTFTGNFGNTLVPGLNQLSIALLDIYQVPIGIAILTYPTGRISSRPLRWLVIVATTEVVGFGLLRTIQLDPARCAPGWCPTNPFLLITDQGVSDAIFLGKQLAGILIWITFAGFVVARYLRGTPASRRLLTPVWFSGIVLAGSGIASVAIETLVDAQAGYQYDVWIGSIAAMAPPVAFLVGLLRQRLDRAGIAGFVEEIAGGVSIGGLRDAFAALVGDPGLVLAFPIEGGGYVAADGSAVELPAGNDRRVATPIRRDGREVAVVIHDEALQTDPSLVRAAGAAAGLALENERLTAEVRARLEAIRSSRARLVVAADAERVRIERMLHDGAQQRLVALASRIRSLAGGTQDPATRDRLDALGMELDDALGELRELARGIHPAVLVQAGLGAALASLAQRSPVPVILDVAADRYPPGVESTAYYVAAEALTNAARHAHASTVTIRAWTEGRTFRMTVTDDGVGGADPRRGSGLAGLEDRVAAISGSLGVLAAPDGGTVVDVRLPMAAGHSVGPDGSAGPADTVGALP